MRKRCCRITAAESPFHIVNCYKSKRKEFNIGLVWELSIRKVFIACMHADIAIVTVDPQG